MFREAQIGRSQMTLCTIVSSAALAAGAKNRRPGCARKDAGDVSGATVPFYAQDLWTGRMAFDARPASYPATPAVRNSADGRRR
jgi:hypothetical protein